MPFESDRIMFEIYREPGYNRRFRVVYFTELDEHNKEHEINAAIAGEHFYDGFILTARSREAKQTINHLLNELNSGRSIAPEEVEDRLADFVPA